MKTKSYIFGLSLLALSCSMGELGEPAPTQEEAGHSLAGKHITAIVTVKRDLTQTVWFQLNDSTRLCPAEAFPFTRQQRLMGEFIVSADEVPGYGYRTQVVWTEAIEEGWTVDANLDFFNPGGEAFYGLPEAASDGIDPVDSWITGAEDGYLTLLYNTWWGQQPVHHDFYLYTAPTAEDPFRVVLRQDSHGDAHEVYSSGMVCFDLDALLPDTGGATVSLTLTWTGTDGKTQERQFGYRRRK